MKAMKSIIIIDDNQRLARQLADRLAGDSAVTEVVCTGFNEEEIAECMAKIRPSVVVLDLYDIETVSQRRGVDLVKNHGEKWRKAGVKVVLLLTVIDSAEETETGRAIKAILGDGTVDGYVRKPATSREVLDAINTAIVCKGA